MNAHPVREAIEANDPDGLVRLVDGFADGRDWDAILDLRHRCREAVERGKQLWGVAHYANYRLALNAPVEIAGPVVGEPRGQLLPGPLTEVLGTRFTWSEVAPHLPAGPEGAVVAQERIIRGEDLRERGVDGTVLDLPLHRLEWERFSPIEYRSGGGTFDPPDEPPMGEVAVSFEGEPIPGDEGAEGLFELGLEWLSRSNGRVEVACINGTAEEAIASLGPQRVLLADITLTDAVEWMTWLGASGGAYGSRRGGAAGRSLTWWALAALTGLDEDWPVTPDDLGEAAAELRWVLWSDLAPSTGWTCHLAVEDPLDGLAWALTAVDGA
ncbi:MAG: hypothetical protein HKN46_02595 [Acidimicrobiia bacterium]|nr:hypothetical protein [Acidimicrobiia bacterium]